MVGYARAVSDRRSMLVRALLEAYRSGFFPMADPRSGRIEWFSPDPRAVVPLEPGALHFSKSLRQRVRSGRFAVTTDQAFSGVVRACARPRPYARQTWIDARIIDAYEALHEAGHAHSVEAWLPKSKAEALGERWGTRMPGTKAPPRRKARQRDEEAWPIVQVSLDHATNAQGSSVSAEQGPWVLVGGLYGVHIGSAFFGESMFSAPEFGGTDASKVCFMHMVAHLRARGFRLLDSQFANDHMSQFGIAEIPREDYLERLEAATRRATSWASWNAGPGDAAID